MSEAEGQEEFVTIARVVRARGNRGEVAAEDLSDDPSRFAPHSRLFLQQPGHPRREAVLEEAWFHKGRVILKLEGVDSIGEAELLRGCEVQIPRSEMGPPPEGEFYIRDLIGARVLDADSEREIGRVEGVLEPAGTLLLQVKSGEREILIPFAGSICVEVVPAEGIIRVRLPEGLEELNP